MNPATHDLDTPNPDQHASVAPVGRPERSGYPAFWRRLPRELAYLLIAFPISLVGFTVTIGLFSAGLGTIITFFIGLVLIVGCLYIARGFGSLELLLLGWTTRREIRKPEWQDARARTGFLGWVRAVLGNGHYWLYLLYVMVIDFIAKTVTWVITVVWISIGLGGVTFWLWDGFISEVDRDVVVVEWIAGRFGVQLADPRLADNLFSFVIGVLFLATLPFITRGMVMLHWLIARGVLGAWKSDALQREVETLSESRGAAQSAEGHSLRRLERDIHDGPQQRLVRLQMDLAAAERQLDSDPVQSRTLIAEAMQQSKDALEELRSLSRGFAPPILLDRGLIAALESAAVRSSVATNIVDDLPVGFDVPQEIERNAYFIASEALMNAATHSGATGIEVRIGLAVDPAGRWLEVTVTDDGHGGAHAVAGRGIAGLSERLRGLGGTLDIHSPAGGPTVVSARVPLGSPAVESDGLAAQ